MRIEEVVNEDQLREVAILSTLVFDGVGFFLPNEMTVENLKMTKPGIQKRFWIAYLNNKPIGTIGLIIYDSNQYIHIFNFAIIPSLRKTGLGLELLKIVEVYTMNDSSKLGTILDVFSHPLFRQEKLLNYYERQGYKKYREEDVKDEELLKMLPSHYQIGMKRIWFFKQKSANIL